MECTRLCLLGVSISMMLLSSVVVNGGYSLAHELTQQASTSRRRDNSLQTVLDLLDFAQEEEDERHLQEEYAEQTYNHREKRFPRIPMGRQCEIQRDCKRSHCCAMKWGRSVCRERPTIGKQCRPNPQSPLNRREMSTSCPCARGLTCWRRKGKNIGVCV